MLLLDLWFGHISRLLDVIITLTYDRILDGVYAINILWIVLLVDYFLYKSDMSIG